MTIDEQNKLGTNQLKKGDYDGAISSFTTAILGVLPDLADSYYKRSLAYRHKKQYDHAIADATKAIEANPSYAEAYYNRGYSYQMKDMLEEAVTDLSKAI